MRYSNKCQPIAKDQLQITQPMNMINRINGPFIIQYFLHSPFVQRLVITIYNRILRVTTIFLILCFYFRTKKKGYGNIAPTEIFGRYFMIVYALIGMPVNMILYAYLGEYFGTRVISCS